LAFAAQPVSGDLVTIKDGTTERSYGAVAGGDVQYAIGGSIAATLQNLVTAINGDGSATWAAELRLTEHPDISADGVIAITENFTAAGDTTSRIFGVWATQAEVQVVEFAVGGVIDLDYSDETVVTMPAADPAEARFGLRRVQAALTPGEMHFVRTDDTLYSWDDDDSTWQILSGPSSIPDATAASGGGIKGKITVDSDLGLAVSAGVLSIDLATNPGLEFSTGDLTAKVDTTAGMELVAGGIAVDLAATPGLEFSGGDLTAKVDTTAGLAITASGIEIDLDATAPGLEFSAGDLLVKVSGDKGIVLTANGVEIEIDDSPDTLDVDADGLKVVGLPSLFKINGTAVGATVTAPNADTLTDGSNADALHVHSGTAASQRVENSIITSENITDGDPVYWSGNDTVGEGDAGVDAKARVIGVATATVTSPAPVSVVSIGEAAGVGSGWTANDPIYLADAGGLTSTRPSASKRIIVMGYAMNGTDLWVDIRDYGKRAA
jgi:hypothetical protein